MPYAGATVERFDMGRVVSRLFGVLGRNFVTLALLSLVLAALPATLSRLLPLAPGLAADSGGMGALNAMGLGLVSLAVTVISRMVLQGAVIHATVSDLAGQRASFDEVLSTGVRFMLPLIGLAIISGIGIAVGFILLIVPGVLIALTWTVAGPACVMERTGVFNALDRSATLTRNHRGAIFGLAIAYIILEVVIGVLGAAILGPFVAAEDTRSTTIATALESGVGEIFTAMIGTVGVASIYFELRYIKDGVGAEQLAAVFD